jgi:phenylacetate-CoA ligase
MIMETKEWSVFHEIERMDPGKREQETFSAIQGLIANAWEFSSEFRERMRSAGLVPDDVRSYQDFTSIPTLNKKELIKIQEEDLDGMLSCDLGELSRIYMSPGPLFDPEGRATDYWGWDEAFYAAGFRPKDLVQMTFSYHLTPAGLMLEEPLRNLGCAVIPAGPGNTEAQIQLMNRLPVTGFVGMASFLKIIADKAEAQGLDLKGDFSLRVAFVAAERLTKSLRSELEERFGMTVRQGYGTADVGAIAYECTHLTGMHLSTRCLVEICEPGTGRPVSPGEVGEVVVTPLNETYPLVRLATGDLSRMLIAPCPCGRTTNRLEGILGRTDLTAKVKGQFIYPHQIAEVMNGFPQIMGWQLVITNPGGKDAITLWVAAGQDLEREQLVAQFQSVLKLRPSLELVGDAQEFPAGVAPVVDRRTWDH